MTVARSGWWVVLMVMLGLPLPLDLPIPERAAPIAYLCVFGALVLFTWVGRHASWPFAVLLGYSFVRIVWSGLPLRGVQIVVLMAMCAVLYVDAVSLSRQGARRVAWAFLVVVAFEAVLGVGNVGWHLYPAPTLLKAPLLWLGQPVSQGQPILFRDFVGRPMGWLTHPNYWGSFMALSVPVVYCLMGRWAALVVWGLTALSGNIGPVVSAGAGLAFISWRDLSRALRCAVLGAVFASVLAVSFHHLDRNHSHGETWLSTFSSGRTAVWVDAWPSLKPHWFVGNGVGSWRVWAEQLNRRAQKATGRPDIIPETLQAHDEAYQLWFELGFLGLLLGAWWAWQLSAGAASLYWKTRPVGGVTTLDPSEWMWPAVVVVAIVNSLGSPTFHLPQQAAVSLFAAARLDAARRSS